MRIRTATCAAVVLLAFTGCTGQGSSTDAATRPGTPSSVTTGSAAAGTTTGVSSSPSDSVSGTGGPFDCAAVAVAQKDLNDASREELSRLGIDRTDARAFPVTLVVASQHAAEYWRAVNDAATPELDPAQRKDLELVSGYWGAIDAELDAIEFENSSQPALQHAADELTAISQEHPQRELGPAQQRLQDLLSATCGIEPGQSKSVDE